MSDEVARLRECLTTLADGTTVFDYMTDVTRKIRADDIRLETRARTAEAKLAILVEAIRDECEIPQRLELAERHRDTFRQALRNQRTIHSDEKKLLSERLESAERVVDDAHVFFENPNAARARMRDSLRRHKERFGGQRRLDAINPSK